MKVREGFILTEIADDFVAVPTGAAAESFRGIVRLNATGARVFKGLQNGLEARQIAAGLVEEYEVEFETAYASVQKVIGQLLEGGILEV